jgi:hypothetical protein
LPDLGLVAKIFFLGTVFIQQEKMFSFLLLPQGMAGYDFIALEISSMT